MKTCDGCRRTLSSQSYDVFDYCAVCGKNLCPACMEKGHCGNVPAKSGMEADSQEKCSAPGCQNDATQVNRLPNKYGRLVDQWFCDEHAPKD